MKDYITEYNKRIQEKRSIQDLKIPEGYTVNKKVVRRTSNDQSGEEGSSDQDNNPSKKPKKQITFNINQNDPQSQ